MQQRTRRKLFIAFAILFFLSVPVIVLFTQGYRADLDGRRLVKTGGIDLDIVNENSRVFLNGQFKKESGSIFRNVVFKNIYPNIYNVRIEKDNYFAWEKNIEVLPEMVSRFLNIQLFPTNLSPNVIAEEVKNVFISPDSKFAIAQKKSKPDAENSVILINLENGFAGQISTLDSADTLRDVQWSSNSRVFSVTIRSRPAVLVYTGTVDGSQVLIDWSSFLKKNFPLALNLSSRLMPATSPDVLFVLETEPDTTFTLHQAEFNTQVMRTEVISDIIAVSILNENAYYIDTQGAIRKMHIPSGEQEKLSPTAISNPITQNAKIIVREDEGALAIINRGNVFLLEREGSLLRIAANMLDAVWPTNKESLMYWNKNRVEVYWLKDSFGPPQRVTTEREIIEGFANIKNAGWTSKSASHILVQTPDSLEILEIDDRDRRSAVKYNIKTAEGVFAVNMRAKKIYTKTADALVSLSFE
jgi:hypothetical protein